MNWDLIQNLFDGQGLVFWAAVAAVALGLTMLSVSIVFQLRRVFGHRRPRIRRPRRGAAKAVTAPRVTVTTDGYQAAAHLPEPPAAAGRTDSDPLLNSLRDRLKTAADRLERIHGSLDGVSAGRRTAPHSGLKDPASTVDYIYKSARA